MNAAQKVQVGRWVRLLGFSLLGALLSSPLASTWALHYPVLGLAVGALEVLYRTAVPTQPAPKVTAVPADAPQPPGPVA